MSRLYIPNSIALRNFDSIFKNNDFIFDDDRIDISFHPTYVAMHPVGIAFYAALADYWREKRIDVNGTLNLKIRSIPYLQRMGLFSSMGFIEPLTTKTHDETGRFIPLTKNFQ